MKTIQAILVGLFLPIALHAQLLLNSGNSTEIASSDSIVQITAEAEGLSQVTPDQLPFGGTYWTVLPGIHCIAPMPLPMVDANEPIYQITDDIFLVDATGGQTPTPSPALAQRYSINNTAAATVSAQGNAIADLIEQIQEQEFNRQLHSLARAMDMDDMDLGDGDGADYTPLLSGGTPLDTNQLWLEITNISNGTVYANLHNATNQVYAIESTSDLFNWQVELELWPSDTNCQPFDLASLNRSPFLLRAEDWTGVDSDGDGVPDWWAWRYWGTISLADTNLDYSNNGNTFAQDYSNSVTPTVFSYEGIEVTNNYWNTSLAAAQLVVSGTPYYLAVSVDDTNYATDAAWNIYNSSNITVNLGTTEGWHDIWIGLRGHGGHTNEAIWRYKRLKLDLTPPNLVITNPTNRNVTQSVLQLVGYSSEELSTITYDITNAAGLVVGQPVFVTSQNTDTNTWEFTTNYFQAFDIPLTNGINTISLHATDMAGNVSTTNMIFTLDYSTATNAPLVQITWPQNGAQISGTNFTLDGQLDNPTASVVVSTVNTNGTTNTIAGIVGRDGKFWVEGIPLIAGTNSLILTMNDAAGNMISTNISIIQNSITLTMDDVTPDSQLWQPTVNVTGKILTLLMQFGLME